MPERITDREKRKASRAMDCINCLACYSACPVLDLGDETSFSGPAPLVQLAQLALDPRDGLDRSKLISDTASAFECVSCYTCEEVCPANIPIVSDAIEPLKAIAYANSPTAHTHQHAFLEIVRDRGRIDPISLVLKTQGLRALANPMRAMKLFYHGKISPLKTFTGWSIPGIAQVRRVFTAMKGSEP